MADYIYDSRGRPVGYVRGRYIHKLSGEAVGQLNGTRVHKLSGQYVGELHMHMVVDKPSANYGSIGHAGSPGNAGHRGNPGIRGVVNCGYREVFGDLLS